MSIDDKLDRWMFGTLPRIFGVVLVVGMLLVMSGFFAGVAVVAYRATIERLEGHSYWWNTERQLQLEGHLEYLAEKEAANRKGDR